MKTMAPIILILAAVVAIRVRCETCSDEALKGEILRFMRPIECCEMVRGQPHRPRVLTERISFDGDTNRLARLLAELSQTNNVQIAQRSMALLVKYGTSAQLPFLYSCATNPAVGDRAVRAVLRIEGVTSNSVSTLQGYLSATNHVTREQAYGRALLCKDFLSELQNASIVPGQRELALQVVRSFAANVNTSNSIVDEALVAADGTYRCSKRRLAVMRAAYPRCFNEYQTNFVANVISELVAYPEADLPD